MVPSVSLANKCQLLFGVAVLLILAAALSVPWIRTHALVRASQIEAARQLADAWLANEIQGGAFRREGGGLRRVNELFVDPDVTQPLRISRVEIETIETDEDPFLAEALNRFRTMDDEEEDADGVPPEYFAAVRIEEGTLYRYARPLRLSQLQSITDPGAAEFRSEPLGSGVVDPLQEILVIDRTSEFAEGQLLVNRVYIITAGIVAGLLAVLVFYFVLTKLIFSPVRRLRETAETVQSGDLSVRSQIQTGDEFEQLAEAFNSMLDQVQESQGQLKSINETLDLKVGELSEANIGLYESNRLKGEFLANVSHELRTPLNSIIGFAELLHEVAENETDADPKRLRYLSNILASGRSLLEMINQLLEMAKIEAGRMEVNIEPTSVGDLIEGLATLMRPQATNGEIDLQVNLARALPMVETDPGKLQQILFNFVSNAIKFTPPGGTVTLSAERSPDASRERGVRLAVSDTGPGIPYDKQDTIFEKFRQVDASHTREHAGTGLGLAICRDLADLLGAHVSVVSEPNRGATFLVDLPLRYAQESAQPLMG